MRTHLLNKLFFMFVLFSLVISSVKVYSQNENFIGTKILKDGDKVAFQTIPDQNPTINKSFNQQSQFPINNSGDPYVLGGNIIWNGMDGAAIANTVKLNGDGTMPITAWGLNNMRATLYTDVNNSPVWNFSTDPNDPNVAISGDGNVIAVTKGTDFHLLDNAAGTPTFTITMPDSFYANHVAVNRSGSKVVFLAQATGSGTTSRAYGIDLSGGTPDVIWTIDVPSGEINNWAGVNFSADGNTIVLTGRYHIYVVDAATGNIIWDRFLDNSEAPAVISGDGSVIATAGNSGFVQARLFNSSTNEYELLWQYRIPTSGSSSWASSVGISADGSIIVAGSLIFLSSGYDGSVTCFDTFGDGTPKWVVEGMSDLVDDIAVSDDGKVAAAVTWGDLAHQKPDLVVFDVETGQGTFSITTPGSFFTVDLSPDGKRVFAGGKAVHAREFGNGGRIYLAEIDLEGGHVSGNVDLTDSGDDSGVTLTADGTVRNAVTDADGNYLIENIPAGTYTITAEKPGYNFGGVTNVVVTEGGTTTGVDFSLDPFTTLPPTLNATTDLLNVIGLSWTSLVFDPDRQLEIAKAVGDINSIENLNGTLSAVSNIKSHLQNKIPHQNFDVDSIAIFRSILSGGPYDKIASVDISQTSYLDSSVYPLKDYYYVINIFNETGQSIYSNEAHGKVSDSLLTFDIIAPAASIPTIDGVLSPGEWDDAVKVDISDVLGYSGGTPKPQGSVYMYLKFDDTNDMLYVAGEDFLNTTLDDNEGFGLYFDDNYNQMFEANGALPVYQEGNFWAYWHPGGSNLRFRPIYTGGSVGDVFEITDAEVEFTDGAGHLQGEVAIPMGFLEGYQLQVYGPEKNVGLGSFLIERVSGSAIFNGWWPQTMNSVFNPQYFGTVNIDVSLVAPPQPPGNISVDKSGYNLMLNWNDPELGLNNETLPVPPTISIYKNGEFLTTVSAGVESYLDTDVECSLWYEYQFEATIIVDEDTLISPITSSIGNFACADPNLTEVKYDDGGWEAFYVVSFGFEDNKFALKFTPTFYPMKVVRLKTLVNNNSPFDFTINKDDAGIPGDVVAGPYRVSGSGTGVSDIFQTLPGNDPPELTDGDFWVVINYLPEYNGYPGIGTDTNPPNSGRGMYYLSSSGWTNFTGGNLMISAFISDTTHIVPVELISFTGQIKEGKIYLSWQTATETNNHGFEIQRSTNNKNFGTIGFVEGAGTTTEQRSYSFYDSPEGEKLYYRLKQVDYDGTYNYSEVVEINNSIPKEYSLKQNYPNPFNPSTIIKYELPEQQNVSIEIFNSLGQKVATLVNETKEAGKYQAIWDGKSNQGSHVSSGIYIYRINAGKFNAVKKMLLLR